MAIRLAILGLDLIQREWLDAVETLCGTGEIELVAVGHQTQAAARDVASEFKSSDRRNMPPSYDDLRLLLKESSPQVLLMDRPPNATLDFLLASVAQEIAIFSLGPPVESLAEAAHAGRDIGAAESPLCTRGRGLPTPQPRASARRRTNSPARSALPPRRGWAPITPQRKAMPAAAVGTPADLPVRSLSVLAWDAIDTLIRLMDLPLSVFAALRGTIGSTNSFADLSGAASVTLRFADDAAAGITLCDRTPTSTRDLMLWGGGGTLHLHAHAYEFRDADGKLIDAGPASMALNPPAVQVIETLREFLRQYTLPTSPHRGWEHRLEDIAATLEAIVVSHRTGQAESPERFRRLRR